MNLAAVLWENFFEGTLGKKHLSVAHAYFLLSVFFVGVFFSSVACGVGAIDPIVGNVEIYVLKFMVAFPVGFHVGTCHLFEIVGIGWNFENCQHGLTGICQHPEAASLPWMQCFQIFSILNIEHNKYLFSWPCACKRFSHGRHMAGLGSIPACLQQRCLQFVNNIKWKTHEITIPQPCMQDFCDIQVLERKFGSVPMRGGHGVAIISTNLWSNCWTNCFGHFVLHIISMHRLIKKHLVYVYMIAYVHVMINKNIGIGSSKWLFRSVRSSIPCIAVQCVMSRKFWPSVLRVSQTLQFGPVFLFVACRFTSRCLFKCRA